MIGMRGLVITAVVIGLIGYQFHTPAPLALANPYLLRYSALKSTISTVLGILGGRVFRLGHEMEMVDKLERSFGSLQADDHKGLEVIEADFDGVPVVIYRPLSAEGTLPAVMYFHGGGFFMMGPVNVDPVTSMLSRDTPAVVVSVDYRLAPKHPYPAGLNDCYTATKYLMKHAQELKVDPKRIAVAGDSAGGNLAATVSMKFRDMKERIQPKLQIMIAPLLQFLDFKLPSYQQHNHQPLLLPAEAIPLLMFFYQGAIQEFQFLPEAKLIANNSHTTIHTKRRFQHIFDVSLIPDDLRQGYVPEALADGEAEIESKYDSFILDPYVSPLVADSFVDLPEAFVMTVEFDILRDEGILYAKHLERAGVPVTWYNSPDAFHGHWVYLVSPFESDSAVRDWRKIVSFLKKKL